MLEGLRKPIRRRPLLSAVLVALIVGVVVAIITAMTAVSGPNREIADLEDRNALLTQDLADMTADHDATSGELLEVQDELSRAERKLALDSYKQRKDDLIRQIADLSSRVSAEQAKLATAKAEVARSSFGDGTWQANVDFIPGTYQAPGGESCYWAKLSGPSGGGIDNIIDNGGFNNRPVVSVDSPYFETSDCGTWRRVG